MIRDLVGLKWEDNKLDCFSLMVMAQKKLWGRHVTQNRRTNYTEDTIYSASQQILAELEEIADRVDVPKAGDIAVLKIQNGLHAATFVSDVEVLHIFENKTSRISRYGTIFKDRTVAIYRLREVE